MSEERCGCWSTVDCGRRRATRQTPRLQAVRRGPSARTGGGWAGDCRFCLCAYFPIRRAMAVASEAKCDASGGTQHGIAGTVEGWRERSSERESASVGLHAVLRDTGGALLLPLSVGRERYCEHAARVCVSECWSACRLKRLFAWRAWCAWCRRPEDAAELGLGALPLQARCAGRLDGW
jgi:hypothetical protein